MPTGRWDAAAAALDGKIYVLGGGRLNDRSLRVVEVFDPLRGFWRVQASLRRMRSSLAACVLDGQLYAIGGDPDDFEGGDPDDLTWDLVERFDEAESSWILLPEHHTPRGGLAAAALDGHLHVIGGGADVHGLSTEQDELHEVLIPSTVLYVHRKD